MHKLELYNGREPNIVEITLRTGKKQQYKITTDFTVEEIERLYELEQKISDEKTESVTRWTYMAEQVRLALQRFQPDVTVDFLKKNLTPLQMAQIVLFMQDKSFKVKAGDNAEYDEKKSQ